MGRSCSQDDCVVGDETDVIESGTGRTVQSDDGEISADIFYPDQHAGRRGYGSPGDPNRRREGRRTARYNERDPENDPTLSQFESDAYGGIKVVTDEEDIFWIVRRAGWRSGRSFSR